MNEDSGPDGLEVATSSSSVFSPPASPIREAFVRFDSNNPGLKSLNDYYAFELLNASAISECDKSTDSLCPGAEMKDDRMEECLQDSAAFRKMDDAVNDEAYESGRSSEISSEICMELIHETDVTLEKIHETIASGDAQRGTQTYIAFLAKNFNDRCSMHEPDKKRKKMQ